jgi:putative sigma-54 modulation protein
MNLNVTGKNIQITEGLRSYVDKKMDRIKFYFPHLIDVHVVMEVEKIIHKVEITIQGEGKVFHSEYKAEDMYESLDGLIDRVERQIKRYKEKLSDFEASSISRTYAEQRVEKPDFIFTKVREIMPKPMSDEEAVLQLDASNYKFHIYKKSPAMSEEDYKKLLESGIQYQKTVIIKENDHYVVIRKMNGDWEEDILKLDGNTISLLGNKKDVQIEEKHIEDAVKDLLEGNRTYEVFYDMDHKDLSIVYQRRNNTLGLIASSNNRS